MMTFDEFSECFDQVVKAFTVTKAEDKALIYFERLKNLSKYTFFKTCEYAVDHGEKFPTIAKLIEISRNFPDTQNKTQLDCNECRGDGMISKWNHGFRCRCLNGERISKRIPLVPVTQEERKFWYGKLNKEWRELYGKDLVEGKPYTGPANPEFVDKVRKTFGMGM